MLPALSWFCLSMGLSVWEAIQTDVVGSHEINGFRRRLPAGEKVVARTGMGAATNRLLPQGTLSCRCAAIHLEAISYGN
jgi:hypothetical protein